MQNMDSTTMDEDLFLWRLISRGDKKAFGTFFAKYYTILYSYSKYYVFAEDAEEIVQDLMMWLWEKREEFVPSGDMQQYLLRAIKNRCLMVLRKSDCDVHTNDFFLAELDAFYDSTDSCVVNELQNAIDTAIAELPDSYREAFEMNRFQGKTRQAIAEEIGVSIKTVDYRMQQALKILREKLKDYLPLLILGGF